MFFLNQNPFLRVFIPFAVGVIISKLLPAGPIIYLSIIFLLVLFSIIVFYSKLITYSRRYLSGILINILFLLFGVQYTQTYNFIHRSSLSTEFENKSNVFMVEIVDDVEIKQNSVKTIVENIAVLTDSGAVSAQGKMLVYIRKDSLSSVLKYGDRLIVRTSAQKPEGAMNPYAFNYRNYLSSQGIDHRAWVSENSWVFVSSDNGKKVKAFSIKLRNKVLQILKKQLGDNDEYRVASAIVCGYRAELDADLRQTFANAGAMHVMCVSGLHVGILFVILGKIFSFISKRKLWSRILKVFLILSFIWLYALMTGFSASVLRASAMFSFVAMGGLFERKIPIYNSLAASAFVLLLINPGFLSHVGFQLSYLAVIGIVSIYPIIKNHIPIRGKYLSKVTDLIAISIAAQIATAPISLYYFNQFPNYFIITNLVAVPLAGFIIYATIPALAFSNVSYLGDFFAYVLGLLMKILNYSVDFIDKIPGSVSAFVYVSFFQMLLLYLLCFILVQFYLNRNSKLIMPIFLVVMFFVASSSIKAIKNHNHAEMIIPYGVGDAIVFTYDNEIKVFSNELSAGLKSSFKQGFSKYLAVHNIKKISYIPKDFDYLDKSFSFLYPSFQLGDTKGLIITSGVKLAKLEKQINSNIIVLEGDPFLKADELKQNLISSKYVFSISNKPRTINAWKQIFSKEQIPFHNIKEEGYFSYICK